MKCVIQRNHNIVKLITILIFAFPLIVNSQIIKDVGVKIGYTANAYGWNHPDSIISKLYHDDPFIDNWWFGIYGEFFSHKYYSTIIDLAYRYRHYSFDYDVQNGNGQFTVTNGAASQFHLFSFIISEKLKFDAKPWCFYVFAGIRDDYQISKTIDINFQKVFNNSKTSVIGLNSGLGISLETGLNERLFADFYYNPDFTNQYISSSGYVRNAELGIILGVGFNIHKKINKNIK